VTDPTPSDLPAQTGGLAIDVHGHCVPRHLLEGIVQSAPYGVTAARVGEKYVLSFPTGETLRPIAGQMLDEPERTDWLELQELGHQIVAPWLDLQGQGLPTSSGAPWTRLVNDAMAELVADPERRLSAHASLHLADADVAADELARSVRRLGMRSAMIPTSTPAGRLADRRFDALWAAAVDLDAALVLHPTTNAPTNALLAAYPTLRGLFGRHIDTTLVAAELVVSGVFDRFPALQLVVVHGGGFLPYQSMRFDRDAQSVEPGAGLPSDVLRTLYYDTTLMSTEALRFLYEFAGPERVVVGSDFGATPRSATTVEVTGAVRRTGAPTQDTEAVLSGNARRIFGATATSGS
jgi:aminocarboxymuconate-semialdehyde decarboxylase